MAGKPLVKKTKNSGGRIGFYLANPRTSLDELIKEVTARFPGVLFTEVDLFAWTGKLAISVSPDVLEGTYGSDWRERLNVGDGIW